ncbi:small integral membrane protein 44-like [Osmerus eperlanus]|uniref:small integral membrane protein 44-like n=1 Tax=Osmerus eperlanus TaxID=29151 RepID=UPI002E0E6657
MEEELDLDDLNEEVFFENYKPPSRDAVTLPNHIIYLLLASLAAMIALYAIIRHLIKDLIHDLADLLFGVQPEEETSCPWEAKDKFKADWCPETSAELEAMVQAEEVRVLMDGQGNLPAIWVISEGRQPRQPRSSPRVAFGRTS